MKIVPPRQKGAGGGWGQPPKKVRGKSELPDYIGNFSIFSSFLSLAQDLIVNIEGDRTDPFQLEAGNLKAWP